MNSDFIKQYKEQRDRLRWQFETEKDWRTITIYKQTKLFQTNNRNAKENIKSNSG